MQTNNQNKFYTTISKYYAEIFPSNPAQLNFVKNKTGDLHEKQILDIGCATGELAIQLANSGAKVTGIDLNEDLITQANNGIGEFRFAGNNKLESELISPNPIFQNGNMLDLKIDFQPEQFDIVLCFGNTLVHLEDEKQVLQMFEGVSSVLKSGGKFLLQILNYDYIVDEKVSELPSIETENIKFIRKYLFENDLKHVLFQTDLVLKMENEVISNETKLLALKSKDIVQMLNKSGFKNIELHSNFKQEPFGGKHLPLVLSCNK